MTIHGFTTRPPRVRIMASTNHTTGERSKEVEGDSLSVGFDVSTGEPFLNLDGIAFTPDIAKLGDFFGVATVGERRAILYYLESLASFYHSWDITAHE